ncbi:MAG: ABC transporter substrate-binding protein [Thermomicrobiales bacterium]|nr:ABC transporter substrate-binding protein [Thermomicrobiales bacterium]
MSQTRSRSLFMLAMLLFAMIAPLSLAGMSVTTVRAQSTPLSCEPLVRDAAPVQAESSEPAAEPAGELTQVTMGYVPALIFAPVFIAKEKGYFAEFGLDMQLEPLPGGSDMVVLTASGDFDAGIGGTGPAFFNAIDFGLPISVIAPGHQEGSPVATPLMISKTACESGAITSVADLKGKRVSVNARGATEYWLSAALATGGLTMDDVTVETLAFPDAVAALQSGAIDAAMVGEPLATQAERDGIAVRLASDFDVQNIQPTMIFANSEWAAANPVLATGLVAGFLKASRDLMNGGFSDPANLAIIEQYTNVPADLVAASVQPVYSANGYIDLNSISALQSFFRDQDLLEYDEDIDPATFVDTQFVDAALRLIGAAEVATPTP